jgi:hypothetical protein
MTDELTKYEEALGKPRVKWTKADWRMVAHKLAGVDPTETRGRKRKTDGQKYETEQRLRVAEFWRDQAIETESVFNGDVGTVKNRKSNVTQKIATKLVVRDAVPWDEDKKAWLAYQKPAKILGGRLLTKKTDALIRAIQLEQKKRREK